MTATWHQSWIEDMLICPERYRRNHLTGEERGINAANLQGRAVHDTIAGSLVALRDWGLNDEPEKVAHYAAEGFLKLVEIDKESEDPVPWGEGSAEARAQEVEVMASALWERMPGILETWGSPVSIEHTFSNVKLWENWPDAQNILLEGTWDLLTDKHYLLDWKTSDNSWRPGIEHHKIQPIVYARGVEAETGEWPTGFIFVVVNRRGVVTTKPVSVAKERYAFLLENLPRLQKMREEGIFPMNPTSPLCSEAFCPWWNRGCPAKDFKGPPNQTAS